MKQKTKPEKYLVLNVYELELLIKMANMDRDEERSANSVVIRLQHSDGKFPGQLQYTDEFNAKRREFIFGDDC